MEIGTTAYKFLFGMSRSELKSEYDLLEDLQWAADFNFGAMNRILMGSDTQKISKVKTLNS